MKNFTFKTIKPAEQWRSFNCDEIQIKLDKKVCGNIDDRKPHTIRLMVFKKDIMEDGNKNCLWKWITLIDRFESIDKAKAFLKENFDKISKLNLRFLET